MIDEAKIREQLGIPNGADVQIIDLDAQRVVEVVTGGWNDEQIKNKSMEELEAMLTQNTLTLRNLEQHTDIQRDMVNNFKAILKRKVLIGGT